MEKRKRTQAEDTMKIQPDDPSLYLTAVKLLKIRVFFLSLSFLKFIHVGNDSFHN